MLLRLLSYINEIFPLLHVNFPCNVQLDFINNRCYFSSGYFKAGDDLL